MSDWPDPLPGRIVITGANGSGKTTLARSLDAAGPVVHLDALKLTTGWQQRPRAETGAALITAAQGSSWIIEGGPSLLTAPVLDRAELVVWLDPGIGLRAWRLLRRALAARGRTRPELPQGNPDTMARQLRFALVSLAGHRRFRRRIGASLAEWEGPVLRL